MRCVSISFWINSHLIVTSGNFRFLHPQLDVDATCWAARFDWTLAFNWFEDGSDLVPCMSGGRNQGIEGEFPWCFCEKGWGKMPKWLGNLNMYGKWKKIKIERMTQVSFDLNQQSPTPRTRSRKEFFSVHSCWVCAAFWDNTIHVEPCLSLSKTVTSVVIKHHWRSWSYIQCA